MSLKSLGSKGIIGEYYLALEGARRASWVDKVAMEMPSNQETETYRWAGMAPPLREKKESPQTRGLKDYSKTLTNVEYDAEIAVRVADVERDKTDLIMARMRDLAKRDPQHWTALVAALINNGNTSGYTSYDGQLFYDTDHVDGASGTLINYVQAAQVASLNVTTAASPTAAEMEAAILDSINYMMTYKDDQGEPMNEDANEWLVLCPATKIWASAVGAVKNEIINQSTSTLKNLDWKIEVAVSPRLTTTTSFYVFRTDANVKPIILQNEKPGALWSIAEGSEHEKKQGEWLFGINPRRAAGYGFYQLAAQFVLS